MARSNMKLHKSFSIRLSIIFTLFLILWMIITKVLGVITPEGLLSAGLLQIIFASAFIVIVLSLSYIIIFRGILNVRNLESRLYQNEEMYKYVINNTTLGLWSYNLETGQCIFPAKWKEYLGYADGELQSDIKSWRSIIHPEDIHSLGTIYDSYRKKELEEFQAEYRVKKKNGDWIWLIAHGAGVWTSKGELIKFLVTHMDVTANKKNEMAIKESEEKFRTLFNSANDAIVLMRFDGESTPKVLEANERTIKKFGYERDELGNTDLLKMVAVSERENVIGHFVKILEKKRDSIETILSAKDGHQIPVEISNHLFIMNNKKVVLSIIRDITQRKEAEAKLQLMITENENLLKRAIENEKIKSEFFCNISHEFRTPLNIILGVVQLFESNRKYLGEGVQASNYIRILKQNCYRVLRLINNILEINKIDAQYSELNLKNHNIIGLVEDIALSVTDFINNRGMSITFDTDMEERIISCDEYKIERIMLNLLSNAIKYSKPDTQIFVNIKNEKDFVIVTVKDTGIGIQRDKIHTIFDRFTQVDSSLTRRCEGSGIGLSIVKSYVEIHGGEILVESEYGFGTQFTIKLPAKVLNSDKLDMHDEISSSILERINIEFSDIYSN